MQRMCHAPIGEDGPARGPRPCRRRPARLGFPWGPHLCSAATMKNKAWVGIAAGCGGLLFLTVVTVFAVAMWGLGKIGDATSTVGDLVLQQKVLEELNMSFPYTPPGEGQALALEEARFEQYLALREEVLPTFRVMQEKGAELEARSKDEEEVGPLDVLNAAEQVGELAKKTRNTLIQGLAARRMSPNEFLTITLAFYGTPPPGDGDGGLPRPVATVAPAALLAKYQERIARTADPAFDTLMYNLGTAASEGGLRVQREEPPAGE